MKKVISIVSIVLVLMLAGFIYWKYFYTYSEGNRTGMLQKFSYKGNLFKTYEGELVLNSIIMNSTTAMSSEKFYFSVSEESLGKQMLGLEGQKVVVMYQQKNGILPWRGDSQYIVDSVKVLP